MSDFSEFAALVIEGTAELARDFLKQGFGEAKTDAQRFLAASKADLEVWTGQLANGELADWEFASLVRGQADLAELLALAHLGIAKARLEEFRVKFIDLVVGTAFKVFLP